MIEISRADRMWVQLNAAEIHDPGEPRGIANDNFFGHSARRKRQSYGSQPRRALGWSPLLIKRRLLCPIDETFENDRTISNSGESSGRNRQVVMNEIEFRNPCLR